METELSEWFFKRRGAGVDVYDDRVKFDERRPKYLAQIEAITKRLEAGFYTIKEGHKVARLNPTGDHLELPITSRQRARLTWNLQVLQYRLEHGHAQRWDDGLPDTLHNTNPNHKYSSPYD